MGYKKGFLNFSLVHQLITYITTIMESPLILSTCFSLKLVDVFLFVVIFMIFL